MASSKPKAAGSDDHRQTRGRKRAALLAAERTRDSCIEEVRKVSLYGPRGVGRKSSGDLQEEILAKLRSLDLSGISPDLTVLDETFSAKRNAGGQLATTENKPDLVA